MHSMNNIKYTQDMMFSKQRVSVVQLPLMLQHSGFLFYLATIICHFPPLLCCTCGWSAGWTMFM